MTCVTVLRFGKPVFRLFGGCERFGSDAPAFWFLNTIPLVVAPLFIRLAMKTKAEAIDYRGGIP